MFRNRNHAFKPEPPVPITGELRSTHQCIIDGELRTTVQVAEVDLTDPENYPSMPSKEEMELSALIAAGVPLQAIPCGSLLTPTDSARLEYEAEQAVPEMENYVVNNLPESSTE